MFAIPAKTNENESEDDFEKEFKELTPPGEGKKRAEAALKENEADINKHNKEFNSGKSTFSEKLNPDANMPMDEFEKDKEGANLPPGGKAFMELETPEAFGVNGIIMPPVEERMDAAGQAYLESVYASVDRASLPAFYDAKALGLVTVARNQRACGSCAAFAATGVHETCMLKAGTKIDGLDLSEQQLVDCGYNPSAGMNACNGAWPHAYQKWMKENGGQAPHEANYPYLNRNPKKTCVPEAKKVWNSGAKITNVAFDYGCNADKMIKLVNTHGAVGAAIYASDKGFSNYGAGVFQGCSQKQINHAVVVVGYGTEKGVDYWLVKNSWGPSWGDKGFIKVRRGTNECNIENICVVSTCEKSGTPETAPAMPKPKPVPINMQCDVSQLFGTKGITGTYTLNVYGPKGLIQSSVICENSMCRPKIAGPSNACMYICGQTKC